MEELKKTNEGTEVNKKAPYEKPTIQRVEEEAGFDAQRQYDKMNSTIIKLQKEMKYLKSRVIADMGLSFILIAVVIVLVILISNRIDDVYTLVNALLP